ncbi:MAG: helix-turn-helix domain-containing protein [Pseudomonadota bacterium]
MQRTITGLRIRERRRELGLRQRDVASEVGVSAAYLNMIERNKRGIGAPLLARVGKALALTVDQLDGSAERRLRDRLVALLDDPALARARLPEAEIDELIARMPEWARAMADLHRSYRDATGTIEAMEDRLTHDPALGSAVHAMLTEITALRSTSEILAEGGQINRAQRARFEQIMFEQSSRLADTGASLADYFDRTAEARRRRTPHTDAEEALAAIDGLDSRIEQMAEDARRALDKLMGGAARGDLVRGLELAQTRPTMLPPEAGYLERRQALAMNVAEAYYGEIFEGLIEEGFAPEPEARSDEAVAIMRTELAQRLADALVLPAWHLLSTGSKTGWDIEAIARMADGETALAFRRMACLGGLDGPRAAHVSVDAAGRVLARRGALDLTPRGRQFDCPVWPVHRAPAGGTLVAPVELPEVERSLAIAWARADGMAAEMLLFDMPSAAKTTYGATGAGKPLQVGPDCRICSWRDCAWRREDAVVG